MSVKFSFVVPTVKQTQLVKDCINSLLKFEPDRSRYEVIVVDDGSDVHVQNWLAGYCSDVNVKFMPKTKNEGFIKTMNTGLREAKGEYLIWLNNDVVFTRPVIDQFEKRFLSDSKIGIVGAKLLFPDGTIQHAGVVRVPNAYSFLHINKHRPSGSPEVNVSKYFLAVTGALFGITRKAYEDIGQLNENYFIACDDVEYCVRAWSKGFRVFYDHEIEAIHIEGFTRGNTNESKLKKGPEWFLKERETISKFMNDLRKYDLNALDAEVRRVQSAFDGTGSPTPQHVPAPTTSARKLEIGCGNNPQPGYLHLDVRKFPHIDYVCDFSKEKLPVPDNDMDEILSNHSIEHISWRKLPFVLKEWFRVLKPGGRVFLRTPDLEFICRTYLEGKTTPEAPQDEGYITEHLSPTVTPAWWANIKLFAGQDYDSNFHYHCFDFNMIKATMERFGFTNVSRLNIQPVYSPGELQIEAFKPSEANVAPPVKRQRFLVKRRGAMGDVLNTTPIVRRLKEIHGDVADVFIATDCGGVYINNPYVAGILPTTIAQGNFDRIIDLDMAYEKKPNMHMVEAFCMAAFGESGFEKGLDLFPTDRDKDIANSVYSDRGLNPTNCAIVHMAVTWPNRTWSKGHWLATIEMLTQAGYDVIVVGNGADYGYSAPKVYDVTKKLTIHQIAALVAQARCFIGNDSGLIHVAGTTSTPIVGLFTSARGEYRMAYRDGEYCGGRSRIIKPKIECYGCLHKEAPPVVFCGCRRSDMICLSLIKPEMVMEGVIDVAGRPQ